MKWERLCTLAAELPGVTQGTWYRTPSLMVGGKGFVRLKEDGVTVVFVLAGLDDQEALIAARPDVYYITDHYRGYAAVLARLAKLTDAEARIRLAMAHQQKAPRPKTKKPSPRRRRS